MNEGKNNEGKVSDGRKEGMMDCMNEWSKEWRNEWMKEGNKEGVKEGGNEIMNRGIKGIINECDGKWVFEFRGWYYANCFCFRIRRRGWRSRCSTSLRLASSRLIGPSASMLARSGASSRPTRSSLLHMRPRSESRRRWSLESKRVEVEEEEKDIRWNLSWTCY